MPGLTESKPDSINPPKKRARFFPVPRPRTLGLFVILITILAFAAGWLRNELALTLLGAVFSAVLAYCFFGIFLLGVIHRRKIRFLSMTIVNETVGAGKEAELSIKTVDGALPAKRCFWKLPAVFVRCRLCLETRDGRVICHYADPGTESFSAFSVRERGAYYGGRDSFTLFDAPGFFELSFPLDGGTGPRLLAFPHPAPEIVPLALRSGGTEIRSEPHYRKSDELTDHRPYIPGDDPRRINWKLYGHAPLGELFVREGAPEPPPHSRLLVLIDTEADGSLYTLDEARRAADLLCENALAAALELSAQGMDIHIGCTGGEIIGGGEESPPLSAGEIVSAFAWPAALLMPPDAAALSKKTAVKRGAEQPGMETPRAELPAAPRDRAVLILALPRAFAGAGESALDCFIKKRDASQGIDLMFLYNRESGNVPALEEAARVCVNLYNGRAGVHAVKAAAAQTGLVR